MSQMVENQRPCIVVAGLGRCGSSLTMQMLSAAGIPSIGSYPDFEDDRTSRFSFNASWLSGLNDCAVKILDAHRLPIKTLQNHILIWLDREPSEQARSMLKFVARMYSGIRQGRNERRALCASIEKDTVAARAKLLAANPLASIRINFENLITRPYGEAAYIAEFLHMFGYAAEAAKMGAVVRDRNPACLPEFLEDRLVLDVSMKD